MAAGDQTLVSDDVYGTKCVRIVTIALPSTYATGGIPLTTAKFGMGQLEFVDSEPAALTADRTKFIRAVYDRVADKLQLFWGDAAVSGGGGLQEVTNGATISGYDAPRVRIFGRK